MIARSKQIWMVAFFLSKYAEKTGANTSKPPSELETNKWTEAYRMFYDALADGRTIDSFEHTLRNTRDAFDSHLDSNRIGWLDEDGNPNALNAESRAILVSFSKLKRGEIWDRIRGFTDKDVLSLKKVVDDLAAVQNMEKDGERKSYTEGGVKVIISVRYERNIKLRNLAFKIHGYNCAVCDFNFAETYGIWGKEYGEVHHLTPVSETGNIKRAVNPHSDLIVLCANCHRMVHRKKGITLTVEELKSKLKQK